MKLFPREKIVGIFRGFSKGGMEFHADIVIPYKYEYQSIPMHGQFLLVQLENENEGVLGRITSIEAQGRLSSGYGEDYGIRTISEDRAIPEELREQYLKYKIDIRVLGVLRLVNSDIIFAASHRRLPHVGSKVAFLSDEVLRVVSGHGQSGAELGFLAYGEFIYCKNDARMKIEPWMRPMEPLIIPHFDVQQMVSRRTFVFARAGFGKSNLIKLLFSNLYEHTPTVRKRGNREVPVGTIIFDPEGEYYWPDDKNRPGLCDVPNLQDKIVVFTKKQGPSAFYHSFVASDIKLDIRRLRPSDVLSIALPPEKQDQQNVRKLKGLNDDSWYQLVDEIYRNKNAADETLIQQLLNLREDQGAETMAARANMTTVVTMLHDPSSQMLDMLFNSLKEGKICVVDVSQMRGTPALVLSGLILKKIFDHNQEEFTKATPETIPTLAVVEEAQTILGNEGSSGEGPYISWVKEGRKYDLGAVLITQQPGSISNEILSQGDNWFIFHLLSAGDLQAVKRANAHFSDDLLSSLLNEPIPGNCVFWSSAGQNTYPLPIRILSFENMYKPLDLENTKDAAETFACIMKEHFFDITNTPNVEKSEHTNVDGTVDDVPEEPETIDVLSIHITKAIKAFENDVKTINKIRQNGLPYMGVIMALKKELPLTIPDKDRQDLAFRLVKQALNAVFGEDNWDTEKRPSKSQPGKETKWIFIK